MVLIAARQLVVLVEQVLHSRDQSKALAEGDLRRQVGEPVGRQHDLGREAEIAPLARVQEVERDLVAVAEAPRDRRRVVLARAAQQPRVGRPVARVLAASPRRARPSARRRSARPPRRPRCAPSRRCGSRPRRCRDRSRRTRSARRCRCGTPSARRTAVRRSPGASSPRSSATPPGRGPGCRRSRSRSVASGARNAVPAANVTSAPSPKAKPYSAFQVAWPPKVSWSV